MPSEREMAEATRRVYLKLSLYVHAAVYVVVNALLIAINLSTDSTYLWFVWPLLGWGLGLALHALVVFLAPRWRPLRDRMVQRELQRRSSQA